MSGSIALSSRLKHRWRETMEALRQTFGCDALWVEQSDGLRLVAVGQLPDPSPLRPLQIKGFWQNQEGAHSLLFCPLYSAGGEYLGALQAFAARPQAFGPAAQKLLAHMAEAMQDQLTLEGLASHEADQLSARLYQSERARQSAESRFRLMVENTPDEVFIHNEAGYFIDANERACHSLGVPRERVIGMHVFEISREKSEAEQRAIWARMQPGTTQRVEVEHTRADGSRFPVEVRISCHLLDEQKIFVGQVRDLSEQMEVRKKLETLNASLEQGVALRTRQLQEATLRLETILDTVDDAIVLHDRQGRYIQANRAAGAFLQADPEAMKGKTFADIVGDEFAESGVLRVEEMFASGLPNSAIEQLPPHLGGRVLLTTRSPLCNPLGDIVGYVSLSRDITLQQEAERDLRLERERLRIAAQVGRLGVMECHWEVGEVIFNDQLVEIFGLHQSDPSLSALTGRIHPEDLPHVTAQFRQVLAGTALEEITFRICLGEGQIRWVASAGRRLRPHRQDETRILCIFRDVTDSHLAAQRLSESYDLVMRAERMAKIGSWRLDAVTGVFWSSAMMLEMNGVPAGEQISVERLQQMMPPEDFRRVGEAIQTCLTTGQSYSLDVTHLRADGSSFATNILGQAVYGPDGTIIAVEGTVQDISEREAARAQMTAIADSLPKGAIFRLHMRHTTPEFSYVSAGIERLTGRSAEALVRSPKGFLDAIHPKDRRGYLRAIARAKGHFEFEFRLHRPDKGLIWLQVRAAERFQSGERVWEGILLDVTETHLAAAALQTAKEHAEAAERVKGEFLATISHEIRTPMNAVIGMTRLVLQTDLNVQQRGYMEKIDRSAHTLLQLINDTLDFSRIEAGALEVENLPFDLEMVFETLSNATSQRAEEKGLDLIYSLHPDVVMRLQGDALRLGQVLVNLVSNAVKFTTSGEIEVRVEPDPKRSGQMLFSVRDTGIGLTQDQIAQLFQPFTQAELGTARHYGGTGLGLSICKRLVELMGGQIWVESSVGQGSTFAFSLPLVALASAAPSELAYRPRLLVMSKFAGPYVWILQRLGFDATPVTTPAEGLACLDRDPSYDLILCDWRDRDGREMLTHLRRADRLSPVPVVALVPAQLREALVGQMSDMGLQGLLVKPLLPQGVMALLQPLLFTGSLPAPKADSRKLQIPHELAEARVLIVDDNEFNLEVAADFLKLAGMRVHTALSGAEALQIFAALPFDVVLMDMQMPGMDGLETTRRLRQLAGGETVPVVALTAQVRMEDQAATRQIGMIEHLTKPIDENLMFATLARILGLPKSKKAPAPPNLPSGQATQNGIDLRVTYARARGDEGKVKRMLSIFLRDFTAVPDQLRAALAQEAWGEISHLAHRVRGVAGYFGAEVLLDRAADLEVRLAEEDLPPDAPARLQALLSELDKVLAACQAALHEPSD